MRFRLTYQGELRPTQRDPIGDKALLELDLDATQPAQTALLAKLADAWIAGKPLERALITRRISATPLLKMLFALAQADG